MSLADAKMIRVTVAVPNPDGGAEIRYGANVPIPASYANGGITLSDDPATTAGEMVAETIRQHFRRRPALAKESA